MRQLINYLTKYCNKDEISKRRIQLEELEDIIYSGLVPYTSSKAVDAATIAIKDKQESTTTDEEIEKIVSSNLQLQFDILIYTVYFLGKQTLLLIVTQEQSYSIRVNTEIRN